jgi:hypothetical protein
LKRSVPGITRALLCRTGADHLLGGQTDLAVPPSFTLIADEKMKGIVVTTAACGGAPERPDRR